jgi:glutaconate CoA-transferase, subunit A
MEILPLDQLAARITPGSLVAIPPDYSGVSMAATRALVAQGVSNLRILAVPSSGLQIDVLIGVGCVFELETAAVTLGEYGAAPRFIAAVRAGTLRPRDTTCPAIHAALQASEKGIPFMPLRGLIGSDLTRHRPDWKVLSNPFATDDPIVHLPAIRPDIALFHAAKADRDGNVWIGRRRELALMAHASVTTFVTVEEIVEGSLLDDEIVAAGVLPGLYVGAVAEAKRGAWPLAFADVYPTDEAEMARYVEAARTEAGFRAWLAGFVGAAPVAA